MPRTSVRPHLPIHDHRHHRRLGPRWWAGGQGQPLETLLATPCRSWPCTRQLSLLCRPHGLVCCRQRRAQVAERAWEMSPLMAALHVRGSPSAPALGFALGERQGRDAKGSIWNLRAVMRGFSEPPPMARKNSVAQGDIFVSQSSLDPWHPAFWGWKEILC